MSERLRLLVKGGPQGVDSVTVVHGAQARGEAIALAQRALGAVRELDRALRADGGPSTPASLDTARATDAGAAPGGPAAAPTPGAGNRQSEPARP